MEHGPYGVDERPNHCHRDFDQGVIILIEAKKTFARKRPMLQRLWEQHRLNRHGGGDRYLDERGDMFALVRSFAVEALRRFSLESEFFALWSSQW